MEEFAIDGSFKVDPTTKEFDINFDLPSSGLKIKGLSKSFLTSKISEIPNENGIYILEGEEECYVGQSKELNKRLRNHQDKNKVGFTRCFILSHIVDIRQYLDFMEAYAIQQMISQGYELTNTQKIDPDKDNLPSAKKAAARKWVDEFLLFLPVLGFKKTKKEKVKIESKVDAIPANVENKVNTMTVKINGISLFGESNAEVLLKSLEVLGFQNLIDNCQSAFDSGLEIKTVDSFKYSYGRRYIRIDKNSGKKFYIHENMSNKSKIKKLNKLKTILGVDLVIEY